MSKSSQTCFYLTDLAIFRIIDDNNCQNRKIARACSKLKDCNDAHVEGGTDWQFFFINFLLYGRLVD